MAETRLEDQDYRATFTLEDVIARVRALADEKPDFVYQKPEGASICKYVAGKFSDDSARPDCIMARALHALGVSLKFLQCFEGAAVETVLGGMGLRWEPETEQQSEWLRAVQYGQDNGMAWGNAVKESDLAYPLPLTESKVAE